MSRSNSHFRLYGENIEKLLSQSVLRTYGGILQYNIVAKLFSYIKNIYSLGLFTLAPGLYTYIKSWNISMYFPLKSV